MFTGIIKGKAEVISIEKRPGLVTFTFEFPDGFTASLARGASVSVDGVCLTAVHIEDRSVSFDVMQESLDRTTLNALTIGSKVNVERSARFGDEIGGHVLSGHVDCVAEVVAVERPENNYNITFRLPQRYLPYVFEKGYIAINGTSLTVARADRGAHTFAVSLIPETLRITTFAQLSVGARVNIEIDRQTQAIVDTVRAFLGTSSNKN